MKQRGNRRRRSRDWPAIAERVASHIDPARLHPRALEALRSRPVDEPVALACSGGADSVALVLALWTAFPARRGSWLILHFNHRLRGRASDRDERFVAALTRGLGERCRIGRWRRKHRPRRGAGVVSEAQAREARLAFFARAMKQSGARVLVLGHQRDDVAETMLMRLARGSGSGGLAAPRPVQRFADGTARVRPLLELTAESIRAALRDSGAIWCEDATNDSDDFFRNRVRRRAWPALCAASPSDAGAGFAASRRQLEEDDDALEQWLRERLGRDGRRRAGDLRRLVGGPVALVRRAVQRWLQATPPAAALRRATVDRIIAAVVAGEALELSLGRGSRLRVQNGSLTVVASPSNETRAVAPWTGQRIGPGKTLRGLPGERLRMTWVRSIKLVRLKIRARHIDPDTTCYFDPGPRWKGWLLARTRRPGDRYRPLGAPGRVKLQDAFVNRKVPPELRDRLPVLTTAEGAIVWVPGLPPAEEFAVQPSSKTVVQLTYARANANVR